MTHIPADKAALIRQRADDVLRDAKSLERRARVMKQLAAELRDLAQEETHPTVK